ncbi:hypothetical protein Droror1_Dr00027473 [Drosera rotundifolia]
MKRVLSHSRSHFTHSSSSSAPFDTDSLFQSHHSETTANPDPFDGVFDVGKGNSSSNLVNLDSIFGGNSGEGGGLESGMRFSSLPVFDKPVYDDEGDGVGDDVFGGVEGLRGSSSGWYEDVFDSVEKAKKRGGGDDDVFGDLLGGLGKGNEGKGKVGGVRGGEMGIPGFGVNAAPERNNGIVFDTLVLIWKSPARIARLQKEQELNLVEVSLNNYGS